MATKRPSGDDGPLPPAKKPFVAQPPLHVPPACSEEDLDVKILQVQNQKLAQRLRERNHRQELLQQRVDRLEEEREGGIKVTVAIEQHLRLLVKDLQAHIGIIAEETIASSLTNLSNQSSQAATQSLEQFFTSLSASIVDRGAKVFEELSQLKLSDAVSQSTVTELDRIVTERQKSLDALEDLKEQLDPSEVQKVKSDLEVLDTKCGRLENDLADTRFDLEKALLRNAKLEQQLVDLVEEQSRVVPSPSDLSSKDSVDTPSTGTTNLPLVGGASGSSSTSAPGTMGSNGDKATTVSSDELESLRNEAEEATKLAECRLNEADQLSKQITELKQEIEKIKLSAQQVPDNLVKESSVYKSLQTQFSVLMLEHTQVRNCYEEARKLLVTAKNQHIMQLEDIRQEELQYQVEIRDEMSALESSLATTKRDYELLKIEYEQKIAANEQAAPVAKELLEMVNSLQKNIQQLKGEVSRYKARAHKAEEKVNKFQEEKRDEVKEAAVVKKRRSSSRSHSESSVHEEPIPSQPTHEERIATLETEKKALEATLESLNKEQREKVDLISAEKKARHHVDDLKKRLDDFRKEYERKKEHMKEDNRQLQKEVNNKKQEAQALMAEMESIAQAFEEMQEQNIRLLQQLKEKDDANFKLMTERIKANNLKKLLSEEKQLLEEEVSAITAERDRLNTLVQKLEDREKNSESAIIASEKELSLKDQTLEIHKTKALDATQHLQEYQLKITELESIINANQRAILSKTEEIDKESQSTRRVQEELGAMKRKLEKYRQREWATMSDEVLLEEVKTYRTKLNCPVCTSRKKDTVLTKCFHVFCADCIKTRYETRQRKCPKCNAAFGANDFHKIYLS